MHKCSIRQLIFCLVVSSLYLVIFTLWNLPSRNTRAILTYCKQVNNPWLDSNAREAKLPSETSVRQSFSPSSRSVQSRTEQQPEQINLTVSGSAVSNGSRKHSSATEVEKLPTGKRVTETAARPESCDDCFHTDFPTVIDQPDLCQARGNQSIDLVFFIASAISHSAQRRAIRHTWASVTKNNTSNFRHVFVLGTSPSATAMRAVQVESGAFRDVVVMDFHDSYRNLTLKTVSSLRWVVGHCRHARHFMKTDDDVWVNTATVLSLVNRHQTFLQHGFGGQCNSGLPVNRNAKHKWFTSIQQFSRKTFAPYCYGFAYVGSINVAEELVRVSRDVPFFHFEDVYVGLCLERLGFKVKTVGGKFKNFSDRDMCRDVSAEVPTVLSVSPSRMVKLWNASCPETP